MKQSPKTRFPSGGSRERFEFPVAKIWWHEPRTPEIRGGTDEIWRRWILHVQISEERDMIDKLTAEAGSGVLNWMLGGSAFHERRGRPTPPEKVVAATRQYRMESDTLGNR